MTMIAMTMLPVMVVVWWRVWVVEVEVEVLGGDWSRQ